MTASPDTRASETEFWLSCGHLLAERDAGGLLVATDEFLKLYVARPEVVPPADACDAERALHARVLADPRAKIAPGEIAALADADARENWQVLLAFRDHLVAHPSIEAAYLALMRQGVGKTPALFVIRSENRSRRSFWERRLFFDLAFVFEFLHPIGETP